MIRSTDVTTNQPKGRREGAKAGVSSLGETTMSDPSLPPEIFDHVVDLLHDEPKALWNYCIVAKPWVARTRKHLFADIDFSSSANGRAFRPSLSGIPRHASHCRKVSDHRGEHSSAQLHERKHRKHRTPLWFRHSWRTKPHHVTKHFDWVNFLIRHSSAPLSHFLFRLIQSS